VKKMENLIYRGKAIRLVVCSLRPWLASEDRAGTRARGNVWSRTGDYLF